ncbi:hypothetical protein OXX79_011713 [Metschnikowia pulcherrima]
MPGNIGSSNASENTSTLWQTTEESRGSNAEAKAYVSFVNDCFVRTGATKPMTPIEEKGPPTKPWLRLKDYMWISGKPMYSPRQLVPMRLDRDHIYSAREFYFHFKNNFARVSEAHAAYCERTAEGFKACFVDGDAQKIYDDITDEFAVAFMSCINPSMYEMCATMRPTKENLEKQFLPFWVSCSATSFFLVSRANRETSMKSKSLIALQCVAHSCRLKRKKKKTVKLFGKTKGKQKARAKSAA